MTELIDLISEATAAADLNLRVSTLSAWRNRGIGPAYVKVGRRVVYRRCDIASWIASQRHELRTAAARRAGTA